MSLKPPDLPERVTWALRPHLVTEASEKTVSSAVSPYAWEGKPPGGNHLHHT